MKKHIALLVAAAAGLVPISGAAATARSGSRVTARLVTLSIQPTADGCEDSTYLNVVADKTSETTYVFVYKSMMRLCSNFPVMSRSWLIIADDVTDDELTVAPSGHSVTLSMTRQAPIDVFAGPGAGMCCPLPEDHHVDVTIHDQGGHRGDAIWTGSADGSITDSDGTFVLDDLPWEHGVPNFESTVGVANITLTRSDGSTVGPDPIADPAWHKAGPSVVLETHCGYDEAGRMVNAHAVLWFTSANQPSLAGARFVSSADCDWAVDVLLWRRTDPDAPPSPEPPYIEVMVMPDSDLLLKPARIDELGFGRESTLEFASMGWSIGACGIPWGTVVSGNTIRPNLCE